MKKTRNRAAQEATLINLRAMKKRIKFLDNQRRGQHVRLADLEKTVRGLQQTVELLCAATRKS